MKPIKSQQEADKVFKTQAIVLSNTLKIPIDEAERRLTGLLNSGILNHGHPDLLESQIEIEAFLQIPSSAYQHLNTETKH